MEITKEQKNKLNLPLTDSELIVYLLSCKERVMKGKIRPISRQKRCHVCNEPFEHLIKLGYICRTCKTVPNRYMVDLFWKGKRIRIFSDRSGQAIDSYDRALRVVFKINQDMEDRVFDPSHYIKAEQEKYWVSTLIEQFIKYKEKGLAPSYKKDFKRMLNIASIYFKTTDVREIRKIDIIRFKEYVEIKKKNINSKTEKNISPKTVKNIIDVFKSFLYYCKKDLEIIYNVPSFPEIAVGTPSYKWLTQEDQIKLYNLIPGKHKPIFAFLMLHGCRPSEARALRCKDIDLNNATITITSTFSGSVYREKRKGRKSKPVTIPIHPELYDFIEKRVKSNLPEAYVFANPNTGRHYNKNTLQKIWKAVIKGLNINGSLRLYDATRHSFASQLVNNDTSLFKVSKLLGHSSIKMTEKYSHQNVENLRTDLEKLSLTKHRTVNNMATEQKSKGKNR